MSNDDDSAEAFGSMPSGAPITEVRPITLRERVVAYALQHLDASGHEIATALGAKVSSTYTILSQWRNGQYPNLPPAPNPREPEFVECDLVCVCRFRQTDELPGDLPVREVLAGVTCRGCGRLGGMRLAAALEHPPSLDPDDVA